MSLTRDPDPYPPPSVAAPDGAALRRTPPVMPPVRPSALPVPVRGTAIPDPTRPPAPLARRLPQHRGKIERITDEVTGLGEDLKEWVELRVALVHTEINERIEYVKAEVKQGVAAGLFAALGALFLLVTLALGLGWWLGHPFWGFLIVTLLLFALAGVMYLVFKPTPPPSAKPSVRSDPSS